MDFTAPAALKIIPGKKPSTRDTESVRITEDYKYGSAGMRYNNVGRDAEGNIVDVRLTLVGVENAERRYDLRTPVSKKENNGGLTFGWENIRYQRKEQ